MLKRRVIETVTNRSDFPWKGMVRWKNKVALVTGASEGIGAATCRLLATNGMRVLGVSRNTSKVEKMAAELRRSATCTGIIPLSNICTDSYQDKVL
uniref:Dehydrogenase/reductase SDR family member 11 n=1 Tax=Timema tahoe TaxID=61484 RepID=A0A7R9IEC7_9NEOP|nr:unnamed protein product [Timema tahoe]